MHEVYFMEFRKIISLSIALSFVVLAITGIISFFFDYSRITASLHTIFGFIFLIGVLFHFANNVKAFRKYLRSPIALVICSAIVIVFSSAYWQWQPVEQLMDWGTKQKMTNGKVEANHQIEYYEMNTDNGLKISVDLLRAKHYWHPQIAIWIEDTLGNYQQTLFVTKATAKGLFFGGRSKENYKTFDAEKVGQNRNYRQVNALPVWSHQRNILADNGNYAPTKEHPLVDAIIGATPVDNFVLETSIERLERFILKLEINVAFDDNEFYSKFDFPDDAIFHNGTGQLGQPSLVFEVPINLSDQQSYYLMQLVGHGHYSAQDGRIYKDLSTLTTALEIVERVVVGVKFTSNL